jgi:hypothetical protein
VGCGGVWRVESLSERGAISKRVEGGRGERRERGTKGSRTIHVFPEIKNHII